MEREIKFRGKRIDNGEWVYGGYFKDGEKHLIVTGEGAKLRAYEVIAKTVGQYTGLDDKNEQEVYECDILEFSLDIGNEKVEIIKVPVIYYTCEFAIFIDDYENSFYLSLSDLVGELGQDFKVIGDKFQNPEPLVN